MTCVDAQTLGAFVEGTLDGARRREVMEHLERCDLCVSAVERNRALGPRSRPELVRGRSARGR